jgi:hypothetical protein
VAQTFYPSLSAKFQPLANGSLAYAQGLSDVPLLPTFLVEFQARRRRPSRQSVAWLDNVLAIRHIIAQL